MSGVRCECACDGNVDLAAERMGACLFGEGQDAGVGQLGLEAAFGILCYHAHERCPKIERLPSVTSQFVAMMSASPCRNAVVRTVGIRVVGMRNVGVHSVEM